MGYWRITKDGDLRALSIMNRHYSSRNPKDRKIKQFVGPGEKLVLVCLDEKYEYSALFVWRKFISDTPLGKGINCAVFRNESKIRSSELILEAEIFARNKWGVERLYTFVDNTKINSTNPGYCFIMAGWKRLKQKTKINKLVVLEKYLTP